MRILQSRLLFKIAFWLFAEIALTFVGLDDMADYSEFLLQSRQGFLGQGSPLNLVTMI
jgi:hypothetical protein